MDLNETAMAITAWINSCRTAAHIDLCKEAIQNFITDRFPNHNELPDVLHGLNEAIRTRRAQINTRIFFIQPQ